MCSFECFQERQIHSNQDFLPLHATSRLGVLYWDLWYIWAFYYIWALCYVVCVFCHGLPKGEIVRFWVCNVGKPWQKLSLIGLEWSTLKSKTKKLKFGMKKKWATSCFVRLVLDRSKVAYQQKISKHKKPITWPFEAQIASPFFQYLKDIIS